MQRWTAESLRLELKYTWKISRNATDFKTNIIVTLQDGAIITKGEAAPNVRYNESAESCLEEFNRFVNLLPEVTEHLHQIREAITTAGVSHALAFAIESAWIHRCAALEKKSTSEYLELATVNRVPTSYTIPIMETGKLKDFFAENSLDRFQYIKLKVNDEDAYDSLKHLLSFCNQPVMVDANEAFKDVEECIYWLEKIKRMPLVFVEQPMPSAMKDESAYLKKYCPFPLMADEAITDEADFDELCMSFDGINVKLMKTGGYMTGIRLLKEARRLGMKTMIGCMVETTLGISSSMNLCSLTDYADLDSFILLKKEPFELVTESHGVISFPSDTVDKL